MKIPAEMPGSEKDVKGYADGEYNMLRNLKIKGGRSAQEKKSEEMAEFLLVMSAAHRYEVDLF